MAEPPIPLEFDILINDFFLNVNQNSKLTPVERKKVLSIINGFQDGEWRYKKFQDFVWDNIAETSLSYKDRNALIGKSHTMLTEAAKKLRLTDLSKDQTSQGSELAEIVLYGLMKHYYQAIPVVPKIFYKQNAQDNAKGADSVHIVLESDDTFSLWLGEAKFYNSIEDDRLYEVVNSIENSLQTEKLEKENSIISNISDLKLFLGEKPELYARIINFIKSGVSMDDIKPILHVPILLLHECEFTKGVNEFSEEYKQQVIDYHKDRAESYFKKQINKVSKTIFKYSEIHFHLILFPVPEKTPIIESFVKNVDHYKRQ